MIDIKCPVCRKHFKHEDKVTLDYIMRFKHKDCTLRSNDVALPLRDKGTFLEVCSRHECYHEYVVN
ncbi:hypothetical protein D1B31_16345 [Neobacillus notoginsengisoli]|uniref:Uncharacterized protein n=1 Tax=Neobacillus notoginsengisoli TaxID=1578198 RepID=A0A417YRQ9_9BACI|nr:hypothetical protein D1B31_16345 [Neobacillus notoginsengisoli]